MDDHEDEILDELKKYYFEEGKKEVAKNFKDILSDEEISKITGVPLQEVQEL